MTGDLSELNKVESYQYPTAHLGHLSEGQQTALDNFKDYCATKGYYKPATGGHSASHDDATLLRFLRARKFLVKDAFAQFKDTEDFRKKNKIDELYDGIDISGYDETRRLYPQWTGRRDKRGIPFYVFQVGGLTAKRMAEFEKSLPHESTEKGGVSPKFMRLLALYENLVRFALPFCSALTDRPFPETPVTQSCNIVDISGCSLKQFWNLKDHMQSASQLATAHYPETLDRIFIIGAPSFFPTVWGWIKRWFDPITVSKIFILSQRDMKPTLLRYIEAENLPKRYGGNLDWDWGQLPYLEESMQHALEWRMPAKDEKGHNVFPLGPIKWRSTDNGDMVAMAVGSKNGVRRNDTVAYLPAHEPDLKLSATLSRELGPASTTGNYTHPIEGSFFPESGDTPVDSPAPTPARSPPPQTDLDPRVGRRKEEIPSEDAATKLLPIRHVGHSTKSHPHPREGTSVTKYVQQEDTHAEGQMADGTPAVLDHGYGDKTNTMEPATVGQALKDVDVPEAKEDEPKDTSYLGQAKAVASSAYETATTAIGSAESTVMTAVGFGSKQSNTTQGEQKKPVAKEDLDPRVNNVENRNVEEFIRNKYASHPHYGEGT